MGAYNKKQVNSSAESKRSFLRSDILAAGGSAKAGGTAKPPAPSYHGVQDAVCEAFEKVTVTAIKKIIFFKQDKIGYFISSMLAGIFVGLCVIAIMVMKSMMYDFVGITIIQGASFAAALSLVVFAGAELFTGNVFVMTAAIMRKTVKFKDALPLLIFCYIGNFAGSIFTAGLFRASGYLQDVVLDVTVETIVAKTTPLFSELFIRGVLCNILVCLAVWCVYRLSSEGAKLLMIFWAIYIFVVCGFEHSIANMTYFSLGAMKGSGEIWPMTMNLTSTTLGNTLGGILLSLCYWMVARKKPRPEESMG